MSNRNFNEKTDQDLSNEAENGLRGQGSVVEAMRRLRESVNKLDKTTTCYSIILIILTAVMVGLVIIQIWSIKK